MRPRAGCYLRGRVEVAKDTSVCSQSGQLLLGAHPSYSLIHLMIFDWQESCSAGEILGYREKQLV